MKGKILKIKCDPKGKMETMPWKSLKSMQGDFKTLDDEGRQTLRASMEKVGFKAPFFVWYGHDELLDGVQRTDVLEDMVSDGWTIPDKLPVVLIEAKSRQEALEDIARFSSQHGVVTEQGAINLFGIEGLKVILPVTRILNIDIPKLILNEQYKDKDPDDIADIIDRGAELNKKWKVKSGDLWVLGYHRLLCGDATKKEDVERLMDGQKVDICFTSPPYNAGKTPTEVKSSKESKYINDLDNKTDKQYLSFLKDFTLLSMVYCKFIFVNIQSISGNKIALIEYLYNLKEKYADTIIWNKKNSQPAMAENVLNSEFEYIHCFSEKANRNIGTKKFRGTLSNIINIDRQTKNRVKSHNATFPVDLALFFVFNFCNNSVYDPFLGSGTTLIACEKTNRKCYGLEIDKHYCAVILERWHNFTDGRMPERV